MKKGILITGTHRSGSTWVGKMLGSSKELGYIQEPFSPGCRPGVCNLQLARWFEYVNESSDPRFFSALDDTLRFRYGFLYELRVCKSVKDLARMSRDASLLFRNRLQGRRPLMKDPIAVFSSEWLAASFDLRVIYLIRHPAAFVASLKRLNWTFDFNDLLGQPDLVDTYLAPYIEEIEAVVAHRQDIVHQGALFWKIVYASVESMLTNNVDGILIRHEDLSLDPIAHFDRLCKWIEVEFTSSMRSRILTSTDSSNPSVAPAGAVHHHKRDSATSIATWKHKLTLQEKNIVKSITHDISRHYYADTTWV